MTDAKNEAAGGASRSDAGLGAASGKFEVLQAYPAAYAARDIDGYWHVWCPSVRGALSGGQQDTKSAAVAWKISAERLVPNAPDQPGRTG